MGCLLSLEIGEHSGLEVTDGKVIAGGLITTWLRGVLACCDPEFWVWRVGF